MGATLPHLKKALHAFVLSGETAVCEDHDAHLVVVADWVGRGATRPDDCGRVLGAPRTCRELVLVCVCEQAARAPLQAKVEHVSPHDGALLQVILDAGPSRPRDLRTRHAQRHLNKPWAKPAGHLLGKPGCTEMAMEETSRWREARGTQFAGEKMSHNGMLALR